jgi:acid phosphatase class B
MIIALDYDQTFTLDPDFWREVIHKAKEKGHDIRVVTSRWPEKEPGVCKIISQMFTDIPIHFTCKKPKRQFMKKLGLKVDVWIDDRPESIISGDGR